MYDARTDPAQDENLHFPNPPGVCATPQVDRSDQSGGDRTADAAFSPAIFGKTNLLVEWAAGRASPPAGLTLNSDDNDLMRFFRYLTSAYQVVVPRLGEEALDFLQSSRTDQLEMGLTLLINEFSSLSKDIILVLDDVHVLEDETIIHCLDFLLMHLPHNLHLVIASRSEPALNLASLGARGQVTELGADDLRFTDEEVALFFRQTMGLGLPPETIRALEERAEG